MVSILERFLIKSGLQLCANSIHSSLARKKALLFHGPKIVKINKMRVRLPSARSKLFCLFIWQTQFVLLTPIFNQQWYFVIKIVLTYCEFQGDLFNKRDAKIWASTAVSGFCTKWVLRLLVRKNGTNIFLKFCGMNFRQKATL